MTISCFFLTYLTILTMKKLLLFLLPMMGAVWLLSCCKDDPLHTPYVPPVKQDPCPWPDITTEGLKTFGCKIDGVEWVPCVDLYGSVVTLRPLECRVNESDGTYAVSLGATRSVEDSVYSTTKTDASMYFWLNPCKLGLQNIPNSFLNYKCRLNADWVNSNATFDVVDTTANNYIDITRFDIEANIISGTFQMTLTDAQSGKKTIITDGRFDLPYQQQ
jgi:hypothetical protein